MKSSRKRPPLEDWFAELYRKMPPEIPAGYVSCEGPDEPFLRNFAHSARKPSLLDPRVIHVTHCSHCLNRLMELRNQPATENASALPSATWVGVFVVAAACTIGVFLYLHKHHRSAQVAAESSRMAGTSSNLPFVSQSVDLSKYSLAHKEPVQLPLVSLAGRTVELTLILPASSETGAYSVAVKKDRQAHQVVAIGAGTAVQQGRQTHLKVMLHLENIAPGNYYLSIMHGFDESAHDLPLKIVP